ncbi:MAG: TIGR00269 family protein [Thermoplasmata archaeon]|nr:TIGR00269 family protein [Thermoplasmata archaeon]
MTCHYCNEEAVAYSYGKGYCREHFNMYFRGKVRSVIDKFQIKGKIAVALSGGKDSLALFHALHFLKMDLIPFYINLGIPSYSPASEKACEKICHDLGYTLQKIDLADYGISLEEHEKPCSVCGTVKRYLMNRFAHENGCKYVATGHNLSDIVTFALHNLANANIMNFRGNRPFLPGREEYNMVAKIKPLFYLTDKECMNYTSINNLEYVKEKCPFSREAPTLKIKKWVHAMEEEMPGMMLNMAKSFWRLEEKMDDEIKLNRCSICGYPSYGRICKFCRIAGRSKGK